MIQPGERVIVCDNAAACKSRSPTVPASQVLGSWKGSLKTGGEKVELRYNSLPFHTFDFQDWYIESQTILTRVQVSSSQFSGILYGDQG